MKGLRDRLALERGVAALAIGLFVFGFGQELWFRYLPVYLRFLGATPLVLGAFGALKDLLDAAYAYPGGAITDRLGSRRSLVLFGALSVAGFAIYFAWRSVPAVFAGILLVMAWPSLGLPATFSLIGEEIAGARRIVAFTVQAIVKRIPIVIAPVAGGLLIERLGVGNGMHAGFGASIVLGLAMLAILWRRLRGTTGADAAKEARRPLPTALVRLLTADILIRLCEGLPDVFIVVWVIEVRRLSAAQFGVLTAILTATAIVSYLPAGILAGRAEKKWFIVLTYVFFTLYPLGVVLSGTFLQLAAAFAIGGLREIGEPARKAFIVDSAARAQRGRTVGFYYSVRGFSVAGAAAVGGLLWTIRPSLTFLVAAGLGVAGTVSAIVLLPKSSA
jgi:MFS family permease